MSLSEDIARASEAKRIMESTVYREAVDRVQKRIFDDFATTEPTDTAGLQVQRLRLKCLADVQREMVAVLNTGRLAEVEVKREQSILQRAADRMQRGLRSVSRNVF